MKLARIISILLTAGLLFAFNASFSRESRHAQSQQLSPASKEFLLSADQFTLFLLKPHPDLNEKSKRTFQNHPIIAQLDFSRNASRTNLVQALDNGIAEGDGIAMCFNPRHGIRAKKGNETLECLICFECGQAYVGTNYYAISQKPEATFNAKFEQLRIKVPKKN